MTSASAPAERLRIAYSPCPNDTFIFHAWAHGLVPGAPPIDVTYADIDVTNNLVGSGGLEGSGLDGAGGDGAGRDSAGRDSGGENGGGFDVMKISYAALPEALERYELLPCGGALGRGCGPLVLTAPGGPTDLAGRTVAVPSLKSTAFLLFQRWAEGLFQHSAEGPFQHSAEGLSQPTAEGSGPAQIRVLPFRDIMPAVRDGEVDAGLVIHEARFTYAGYGLQCLADLGEWWENTTGAPIPLGAIVARRSLGPELIARISGAIRASVDHAFSDPEASRAYVLEHAEEMDPEVAKAHIALYVNEFSRDLGPVGYAAAERLLGISLERPRGYTSS
jgi:5,8-dihydroxy-2-naphthoate synthase